MTCSRTLSLRERVARSSCVSLWRTCPESNLGEGGAQLVAAYRCGARVRSQTLSLGRGWRVARCCVSLWRTCPLGEGGAQLHEMSWRGQERLYPLKYASRQECPLHPFKLGAPGLPNLQLAAAYRCGARVRQKPSPSGRGWRAARCCVSLWRTCPESNPLPLGEGGAQRRVRVPCRLPVNGLVTRDVLARSVAWFERRELSGAPITRFLVKSKSYLNAWI